MLSFLHIHHLSLHEADLVHEKYACIFVHWSKRKLEGEEKEKKRIVKLLVFLGAKYFHAYLAMINMLEIV